MLIAMGGLPATSKSTLAAQLTHELGGVVLSKDLVRAALFSPPALDYSSAQNEISMAAIFQAARYICQTLPQHPVIIDGRTFLRSKQIADLFALAASLGETPRIIECVCAEEIARQRLEHDLASGTHPAKNRTFDYTGR